MKFQYENLSDDQFEELVLALCQRLLGMGTKGFSRGRDGGRDAKFVGTAERFPSKAEPWKGTTIIQAKHSNGYLRRFSDSHFFRLPLPNRSTIGEEIPRIKRLVDDEELDHYILFSNRGLTAAADKQIVSTISGECGIQPASVYLCGLEQLERWMIEFADLAGKLDFHPLDSPLIVSPDDLARVISAFVDQDSAIRAAIDNPPVPRIDFATKNELNNMSSNYARTLRRNYLKETPAIQSFLASPENSELAKRYNDVAEEFKQKIISKRREYDLFDEVMEYLLDLLFSRDPLLRSNKRITRAMLFYMYWICDIGTDQDAATE